MINSIRLVTALVFALLVSVSASAQPYSRDAVLEDIEAWLDWVSHTHPDLSHSSDPAALAVAREELEAALGASVGHREAWLTMGRLNPLFNDAHTGLALPAQDGLSFAPVEIQDGRVFVAGSIARQSALRAGDEILAVNGQPMREMIEALVPTIRGESDRLRTRILELRFAVYLGLWLDGAAAERLTIRRGGETFEHVFNAERDIASADAGQFELTIDGATAHLTVRSFSRELEAEFLDFLPVAFAQIAEAGANELVIDLTENGGGARELANPLLGYLTADRFTAISAVTARIVEENVDRIPGAQIGQVVSLPFAQCVEPPAGLANRFEGGVTVLIGPDTYSQAIVFATVVQDFGIGRIAGEPTEGAANQTGQVQRFVLPNTGFEARAPLYIFTRASGATGNTPVMPDGE